MAKENGKYMKIINIGKGMFQYFIIFHFPKRNKIHTHLLKSSQCLQNHVKLQHQLESVDNFKAKSQKRVKFANKPNIKITYVWQFAYKQARKDKWQEIARDRAWFKRRVDSVDKIISEVLKKKYAKFLEDFRRTK